MYHPVFDGRGGMPGDMYGGADVYGRNGGIPAGYMMTMPKNMPVGLAQYGMPVPQAPGLGQQINEAGNGKLDAAAAAPGANGMSAPAAAAAAASAPSVPAGGGGRAAAASEPAVSGSLVATGGQRGCLGGVKEEDAEVAAQAYAGYDLPGNFPANFPASQGLFSNQNAWRGQ